jgi:hypothetical protein
MIGLYESAPPVAEGAREESIAEAGWRLFAVAATQASEKPVATNAVAMQIVQLVFMGFFD